MSKVTTPRHVDIGALPFQASSRPRDDGFEIEASVTATELQKAVDAAPDYVPRNPASLIASAKDKLAADDVRGALADLIAAVE